MVWAENSKQKDNFIIKKLTVQQFINIINKQSMRAISNHIQQKKKTKRSFTTSSDDQGGLMQTVHAGMNYFHELCFPQFIIRKNKNIRGIHSQSVIQDTPIYDLLQDNKKKLSHIHLQVNDLRQVQFNEYIKKSIRYQQLLDINDNKKKHLTTMNKNIGEVIKKAVQEQIPKKITFNAQATEIKIQGWKPQAREGHTLVIYKDQAILIGGHCSAPFGTISIYSFLNNSWIKSLPCDWARSYHSTILYKNRFAVSFGGMGYYNKSRKSRDCFNTIFLIDLLSNNVRNLKMHNQESVQPRRCHTATLLGRYMIVIGGINPKKEYLNDFVYLDLKQLRWYHKQYRVQGKQFQQYFRFGIAKHAAVSTFKPRKNYAFYASDYQQFQGIFCFGGYNGNEQPNTLFHLILNKFIPTFKRVQFTGNPSSPVSPITEWYNENTIIVISGEHSERQIKLFKVKERTFIQVQQYSMITFGGIGSALSKYNDEYYLFYGFCEEGYSAYIYKFLINEQVKQSGNKKKKWDREMFRQTNYLESDDTSAISQRL